jgi:endonuclease/exonuclease/phosphatase family metal-dependent hydrolase
MVTWVKLQDQKVSTASPIAFFNTHFDNRGPQARLQSARLLRQQIDSLAKGCAVIVTGDFNSGEGSEPYKALFGLLDEQASPLVDCYRVVHPQRLKDEGTATGFKATSTGGSRMDWIASSREWQVEQSEIVRAERDGRTPSDHFPVTVVLRR